MVEQYTVSPHRSIDETASWCHNVFGIIEDWMVNWMDSVLWTINSKTLNLMEHNAFTVSQCVGYTYKMPCSGVSTLREYENIIQCKYIC